MALTLPPALAAAVCLLWAVGSGPAGALLALAAVWLYTLLSGALGLVLGAQAAQPPLDQRDGRRQNQSAAPVLAPVCQLGGFGPAGRAVVAGPGARLGALGGLAACCAVLAAFCAGTLAWLRRGGARAWQRL